MQFRRVRRTLSLPFKLLAMMVIGVAACIDGKWGQTLYEYMNDTEDGF